MDALGAEVRQFICITFDWLTFNNFLFRAQFDLIRASQQGPKLFVRCSYCGENISTRKKRVIAELVNKFLLISKKM